MPRLAFCVVGIVLLLAPPHGPPPAPQNALHLVAGERAAIDGKEREKIKAARAVFERQPAIHISFRRLEFGVEEQLPAQLLVMQPHDDAGAILTATEDMGRAVNVDDGERALLDEGLKQITQWPHTAIVPQ